VQALIGCGTAIKALVAQVEKPETESLWQEATSPDGKTYYWHTVTKFVSWVKPSELGGTVGDKVRRLCFCYSGAPPPLSLPCSCS
jgi:hypothetical protein